jgi:type I restriction enzyme S subunit
MKWTTKPLAEVADFCLGKMLDDNKNRGEPLPYLANVNVRWGEFDLENLREMRFEHDEMDRYGLKCGDIVMCEGGEPGRCAIWKEPVLGMMIQKALHRIRPHDCLDHRFLFYSFLHQGQIGNFAPMFTGATIRHLPRQQLAKVQIEFPQLEVQRRIADGLSAYDDLIENNRRRMALLEKSARLLYEEWFVRLRFPDYQRTRFVGGIPERWSWLPLESVCLAHNGIQTGPFGSQLHQSDYSEDGVPVVMPKDLIAFRIAVEEIARIPESLAQKLSRHQMTAGDTVYGRRGDIGRRAFVSAGQAGWICGTGCLRIRPNPGSINPRFLFDALGSPQTAGTIANRAKGATMLNLNSSVLKSVPVLVAPRRLQDVYAAQVEPMAHMVELLSEQNQKLRAARDLLLPRLMSGEIAV